jgi:nidogen (entactin)
MNGKVSGLVNEIKIDSVDLHAYIVTEEGRSYTGLKFLFAVIKLALFLIIYFFQCIVAISRVSPNIGFDLQTLSTIGGVIGWLFASTKSGAPNGFVITGIINIFWQ